MSDVQPSLPASSVLESGLTTPTTVENRTMTLSSPLDETDSQSATIHLALAYAPVLDAESGTNRWLWVSLYGTAVSAAGSGQPIANGPSTVGWYLSETTVEINVGAGFTFDEVQPSTQECTGSVTSALMISGGVFGDLLTASATSEMSFTENLTSIQLTDHSVTSVSQTYTLNMSLGGAYSDPEDLVDAGVFKTPSLYGVPDVAIANLPILTQAVWLAPESFDGQVPLEVTIEMTLNFITLPALPLLGDINHPVTAERTVSEFFYWTLPFTTNSSPGPDAERPRSPTGGAR